MKIEWSTVWEIVIGILIGGGVLLILNDLFGHLLVKVGTDLTN